MTSRTFLVGLDGATFTVLDALMADGIMPRLQRLTDAGSRAVLRSVVPALTPPAWTSLVTGRGPGRHGVFDFFRRESASSQHIRFITSRDIEVETIWSLVNRYGVRATVLNFPLTFPAPPIDGNVVPGGWMPWRQLRLGCHPEGLYDRLKTIPGFNPRELAMDMTHEEKALEGCGRDEYLTWIDLHIRRERQWFSILERLEADDPSELTAIMFDGVDKLQHLCWRFLDPALVSTLSTDWELAVRERCLDYFRAVDELIGRIHDMAGPAGTLIIASDHGFGPQVRTFFINAWLEQRGDLAWTSGRTPRAADGQVLGMGQLARHVYLLDWARTRAYAPMPSGNGIHIVERDGEHPGGIAPVERAIFRDRLKKDLLAVRDPRTGERVVRAVWTREEIFGGPAIDVAPDLTLELTDGGLVSILASDQAIVARPEPTGTHRPEGIFVGCGPQLAQGARTGELSILDVAPLILHTLGVPVPREFEGRVPESALRPEAVGAPTRRSAAAAAAPVATGRSLPAPALDAEAEAEILRRLQALGYVE
jgi:predicted AlkP superfamily phosphohydrolase/phosphomutase